MSPQLEQLVREAMELTGAAPPELLADDAPVPGDDVLAAEDETGFYLVGLIGGKDVGKSALVNALVGQSITAVTSHGAGTEIVIAYAHTSQQEALRVMLDRHLPGQYRIVTHDLAQLRRQVLLDLPDIDSKYAGHLQITRTMLRHMLFPVWVGSVEKYADLQPQQMLARVAEGNSPENFVFCLSKVDQLAGAASLGSEFKIDLKKEPAGVGVGLEATPWELGLDDQPPYSPPVSSNRNGVDGPVDPIEELRDDYATRLARTLKMTLSPRVFMISAKYPRRYELPALRAMLSQQKSADAVRESKQSAAARQDLALFAWLDEQQLAQRAKRMTQLACDAEELIAGRVGGPILERIVPRLLDDPASRSAMADEILQERVARWPVVKLVHTLLQPVFVLLRSAVARGAMPMQSPEAMVDSVIKDSGESISLLVQSAFAQLRQTQPAIAPLYPHNKLWENMNADQAATNLQRIFADTLQRQRTAARDQFTGHGGAAPLRWLLTIGALLWFPFLQPILSAFLGEPDASLWWHGRAVAGLVVRVLGVDYLLKSAGFLIIYYAVLWLALRWNTQRNVGRLMSRWRQTDYPDPSVNLATQTLNWLDDLTTPIRAATDRMQSLSERVAALRKKSAA